MCWATRKPAAVSGSFHAVQSREERVGAHGIITAISKIRY